MRHGRNYRQIMWHDSDEKFSKAFQGEFGNILHIFNYNVGKGKFFCFLPFLLDCDLTLDNILIWWFLMSPGVSLSIYKSFSFFEEDISYLLVSRTFRKYPKQKTIFSYFFFRTSFIFFLIRTLIRLILDLEQFWKWWLIMDDFNVLIDLWNIFRCLVS